MASVERRLRANHVQSAFISIWNMVPEIPLSLLVGRSTIFQLLTNGHYRPCSIPCRYSQVIPNEAHLTLLRSNARWFRCYGSGEQNGDIHIDALPIVIVSVATRSVGRRYEKCSTRLWPGNSVRPYTSRTIRFRMPLSLWHSLGVIERFETRVDSNLVQHVRFRVLSCHGGKPGQSVCNEDWFVWC
jgi:hypothetical protein